MSHLPDTTKLISLLQEGNEDAAKEELRQIINNFPEDEGARTTALTALIYDVDTAISELEADTLEGIIEAIEETDELINLKEKESSENPTGQ